jgi:hypothetical protein
VVNLGYAAAYVHSFYMLSCVERHVDMERVVLCGMKSVLERCSKGKKPKVSLLQKSNSVLLSTPIF